MVRRLRRGSVAGVVCVALAGPAACGGGSSPEAPAASRNAELDGRLARSLQAELDTRRSSYDLPGATAAVTFADGAQWSGASGVAEARPPRRMEPETPMAIASVTKPIVAALVVALAEDGRLALDDRLGRWLPRYEEGREVTLRQLLNHTSGLFGVDEDERYAEALDADLDRHWTPERTLGYVRDPYFPPGKGWHYSDTNYVLLGLVIERVTGGTVAAELHRRVLDPHGLEDAALQPEEPAPPGTARGYATQGPTIPRPGRYVPFRSEASSKWTAAGMVASAPALARWGQALFGGRVVSRASLRQMLKFVPVGVAGYSGYGLGVAQRHVVERDVLGASGLFPGFASELWHDPTLGVTVAVLWNDPTILNRPDIADALLDIVRAQHRARARSDAVQRYPVGSAGCPGSCTSTR